MLLELEASWHAITNDGVAIRRGGQPSAHLLALVTSGPASSDYATAAIFCLQANPYLTPLARNVVTLGRGM
eukprot:6864507-Pyramimonas_sp.AAC.1